MGALKRYLNDLVCAAAPEDGAAQEAVEFALLSGWVRTTGHFAQDLAAIRKQKDAICVAYASEMAQAAALENVRIPVAA